MLRQRQSVTRLVLCAAAAMAVAGCDSGGGGQPQPVVRLTAIRISPSGVAALAIPVGDFQFTATGAYSNGSSADLTKTVEWTSSDESVATISTTGLATLKTAGSTEIAATEPRTGMTAAVSVSVQPQPLASLEVSPIDPTILLGSSLPLTAWGVGADGASIDYTGGVVWTSADEAVATVSPAGVVTGNALGAAEIVAMDPVTSTTASTMVSVTDVFGLSYVSLSRGSIIGGGELTGTVVLTSYAPMALEITLWSTDGTVVSVPSPVTVFEGADRTSFPVTTTAVTQKTRIYVWAADDTTDKRASLNVRKQPH
jgi:hypothetical protein